jgi:hydroxyacylglutathione hydrolase
MSPAIPVAAFSDNYIWLIPADGTMSAKGVIIVDPGDARPVIAALEMHGMAPVAILITHHHFDHTGGIRQLLDRHPVPVYGPANSPVRAIDHPLTDGDSITVGGSLEFSVIAVPGHTLDHIAYSGHGMVLCGDTLFAGGCGRLFEGTPQQMIDSLGRLAALPRDTLVYCAHEYTLANLAFARELDADNANLKSRHAAVARLRKAGLPSVPSTLQDELDTNPFLRCREPAIIAAAARRLGRPPRDETETFSVIRAWKDNYRPPDGVW